MEDPVELSRIHTSGNSHFMLIPLETLRRLCWSRGDRMVLRVCENQLIVERIPVEKLALLVRRAVEASV